MTALQIIIKEAKSIKAKYPKRFAKWTDYVKQASAIYASKHKGKSPVGKKKVVKKSAKKVGAVKRKVLVSPLKKKTIKKVTVKKVIKKAVKKPIKLHQDTKSHNVNIKVVSGISMTDAIKHSYNEMLRREKKYLDVKKNIMQENVLLINLNEHLKNAKTSEQKKIIIENIRLTKLYLSEYKTHAKELKKHI